MLIRSTLAVVAAAVLALAACGGDDEEATETTSTPPAPTVIDTGPTETQTTATETEPRTQPEPPPTEAEPQTSPEDQPGGAGDEEPARSLALFTGEGGRIRPAVVRVPAFISIRVELRSADGEEYGLDFDGQRIQVSGGLSAVSTTFEGLRPGERLVGKPTGVGNRVRIEATAEPGP